MQSSGSTGVLSADATGSHREFVDYYAALSESPAFIANRQRTRDVLIALWRRYAPDRALDVGDIGCGHGAIAMTWAEAGHRVKALDINEPLLNLARARAAERNLAVQFDLGTAAQLPWPDASVDICVVPELLEHVRDWQACLDEFARVLRAPGILFLTTTNRLCPVQSEFRLPLFSWYPGALKRHYIRLAETTRPKLANYATYPAYNWFTFAELRTALRRRGFADCWDRFDLAALRPQSATKRAALSVVRATGPGRWLASFLVPCTVIAAVRRPDMPSVP